MVARKSKSRVTPADRLAELLAKATLTVAEANEARDLVPQVHGDMMVQLEAQVKISVKERR